MNGNENLKTGQNQVIINVTAVDGITIKKYYINAYKRNEEEEIKFNEEQHNNINEANEIIEKMSSNSTLQDEESITDNVDTSSKNKEAVNKLFTIVGIILVVLVIGIIIIRIRKRK